MKRREFITLLGGARVRSVGRFYDGLRAARWRAERRCVGTAPKNAPAG
jgi:hypothetical protein